MKIMDRRKEEGENWVRMVLYEFLIDTLLYIVGHLLRSTSFHLFHLLQTNTPPHLHTPLWTVNRKKKRSKKISFNSVHPQIEKSTPTSPSPHLIRSKGAKPWEDNHPEGLCRTIDLTFVAHVSILAKTQALIDQPTEQLYRASMTSFHMKSTLSQRDSFLRIPPQCQRLVEPVKRTHDRHSDHFASSVSLMISWSSVLVFRALLHGSTTIVFQAVAFIHLLFSRVWLSKLLLRQSPQATVFQTSEKHS